jgi:hypothetical protein
MTNTSTRSASAYARMTRRIARFSLVTGVAVSVWPSQAQACSCGGTSSSLVAVRGADLVFVGTVATVQRPSPRSRTNPDGSVGVALAPGPVLTTFDVAHTYLGRAERQVVIVGSGADCDEPFEQGEVWLVYARARDGQFTTSKCTRTRPRARASSDLVYLDALEQKRPHGIVYGDVLRRIVRADGQPALQGLFDSLQVVAVRGGQRTEVTTDPGGAYQLVLPPGDYEIWVERTGRPVAPKQSVRIADGADQRLALVADYRD